MNLRKVMAGLLALAAFAACKEEEHFMTLSEKKFSISEYVATATKIVAAMVEKL